MLEAYIAASMQMARYESLLDGASYYGTIPGLHGVWANAETLEACNRELKKVLEAWVLLGLERGRHLPPMAGIHLHQH